MKQNITVKTGPSLATILTIVFIVLKLTGAITWSWIWVLAPMWIGFALLLLFFLITVIIGIFL